MCDFSLDFWGISIIVFKTTAKIGNYSYLNYCKHSNFCAFRILWPHTREKYDVSDNINHYRSNGIILLCARKFAQAKMLNRASCRAKIATFTVFLHSRNHLDVQKSMSRNTLLSN